MKDTTSKTEAFGNLAPWAEPAYSHSVPSPYYKASHLHLRNELRKYVDQHVLPHQLEWEEAGGSPREAALQFAKSGFAFADVPPAYRPSDVPSGPAGIPVVELDTFHLLVSTDETSRVEGGVFTSLSGASVIGLPPILHRGTEAQKRRWLPGVFDWSTSFCLGITEPSGGSDVASLRTTAVRDTKTGEYVVNGTKKWITGAPWATHMTTAVRTGSTDSGAAGLSVIVIPLNSNGVSIRRIRNSGQAAGGACLVELDDVRVSAENLLGREGEGFKIIMLNFNRERYIMAVGSNRKARTCLAHAMEYAHTRHTFGKPLISNQIIAAKFANLARDIEAHWAWCEQIAYGVDHAPKGWQDAEIAGRIALAKVLGGRILEIAAREAQQVFGAAAYQKGGKGGGAVVEQISRDLRMMVVGGGSEEVMGDLAVRQEIGMARRRGWKL